VNFFWNTVYFVHAA